ncbi:FAD-binding oxidoreductase [Qipengyuania sp. MTN3-11]
MTNVDVLIIGGGIAGLSCGAALANRASVVVLERETAVGFHSSGRSATWLHLGIGTALVRALTAASREFFSQPPATPDNPPVSVPHAALFVARAEEMDQLDELECAMRCVSEQVRRMNADALRIAVPMLRTGDEAFVAGVCDEGARRIDSHALLQHHQRTIANHGGRVKRGTRIQSISRNQGRWTVATADGTWSAHTLVNAAGAWADEIAAMAGVNRLGITARRRTIIGFAGPADVDIASFPFLKTVIEDGFYMLPESGRLLASPMDATPVEPGDAQPEEIDVATAAWRVEEATTLKIDRITARWAGLRSFFPDNNPAVGYDSRVDGFFWLAGQGGAGLQTSPALAAAAASLILREPWPEQLESFSIAPDILSPERFD